MLDRILNATKPVLSSVDVILIFSLWVGFFHSLINFLFSLSGTPSLMSFVPLLTAFLFVAQAVAFYEQKKFTWILSSIQVIVILVFSISTFGYILTYLTSPSIENP